MNLRYEGADLIGKKFGRTAENVKDKWKQLGGDNSQYRKRGQGWSLEESLQVIKLIQKATNTSLLKDIEI